MNDTLESFGPIGEYLPLFIIGVIAIVLGFLLANLSKLAGPFRPNKIKSSVYESGMDPVGNAHERFSVKFFMVAMLFILFDIEVVFLIPWTFVYRDFLANNIAILSPILFFLGVLVLGLVYEVKKGALEWEK